MGGTLGLELLRKELGVNGQVDSNMDNQSIIKGTDNRTPRAGHYLLDILHQQVKELKDRLPKDFKLNIKWV